MCGGEDVKGPNEVVVTKHVKLSINVLIFKFEVGRSETRKKVK